MAVTQLAVGDRLLMLAGAPALAGGGPALAAMSPGLEATELARVTAMVADPATSLFDLRVDGDHTYVANDWFVHNK